MMEQHELSEPRKTDRPDGRDGFYVVSCSCGYETSPNGYAHRAQKAADAHKHAKEAQQ